jgi:hypothetical protein
MEEEESPVLTLLFDTCSRQRSWRLLFESLLFEYQLLADFPLSYVIKNRFLIKVTRKKRNSLKIPLK